MRCRTWQKGSCQVSSRKPPSRLCQHTRRHSQVFAVSCTRLRRNDHCNPRSSLAVSKKPCKLQNQAADVMGPNHLLSAT